VNIFPSNVLLGHPKTIAKKLWVVKNNHNMGFDDLKKIKLCYEAKFCQKRSILP